MKGKTISQKHVSLITKGIIKELVRELDDNITVQKHLTLNDEEKQCYEKFYEDYEIIQVDKSYDCDCCGTRISYFDEIHKPIGYPRYRLIYAKD